MLKFKNKFKFGSSTTPEKPSSSPEPSSASNSPRNSMSTTNLSDTLLRLSINKTSDQKSTTSLKRRSEDEEYDYSEQKSETVASFDLPRDIDAKPSSVSLTTQATQRSESTNFSAAAANGVTPDSSAPTSDIEQTNASTSSNPGMLTIKIYNSTKIQLPIRINNNKQILHALAINSNNEHVSQQLLKNLTTLEANEAKEESHDPSNSADSTSDSDTLPGTIASNFLPSIITIPSAENLVKSLLYLTIEFDNNVLVIEPQKGTVNQSTWNQVVSFDVTKKSGAPIQPALFNTGNTENTSSNFLNLNLFIRLPNMLIPESEKVQRKYLFTNNSISTNANNIGDLLIGTIKLPLNLKCHVKPIRLMNHEYLKFANYNLDLASQITKEMGEIMLTIEFKPVTKKSLSVDDLDLLKVIGRGSFGKVMQVVKKDTKQIYALKTLRKQHIVSRHEVTHTLAERTVLARINNPFIVPLKFSFQSPEKLYLVLSFINGGELFWHLQREGKFSMDRSRFYIAELLTALESLHELNVIYRDLKPENILLDYQGHIALCDFGLCKLNMQKKDKTNTFCGTPEYLAPELLLNQGYTRSVDWWTLGTLLYEMLTGLPPFYHDDVPTMYRKILQNPLKFPSFLEGTDAQDLLIKLLQKDPKLRLSEASDIKGHPFFKDIDWTKLLNKSYIPPFKPNVDSLLDTSNFDQDFTNEKPQDSVVDDFLSQSVQQQFGGWTYNGDTVLK